MMQILLTTDTVGGVWTYTVDLARALRPHGVAIALATMGGPLSAGQRQQVELLPNVRLYESAYKLEWMDEPWNDLQLAGEWLLEIERECQPDLIHLNAFTHAALEFAGPVLTVGHSCVLSWWQACKGEAAPASWNRYRDAVTTGLHAADLVVAPTSAMMHALQQHYGPLPRCRVIANGRCRSSCSSNSATAKEPLILCAGRVWDEAKNIAALDSIAGALPWPTFVAGDDRHPSGQSSAGHAASFLGKLDEAALASWYGRAAIYALPARYEPFGLSVLEAALSGCALVLGDIPSLRENWEGAAAFVPPNDAAVLKAAIEQLIADPNHREQLAQAARIRAAQFSAEAFASAYLSAYRQLIDFKSAWRTSRRAVACAS